MTDFTTTPKCELCSTRSNVIVVPAEEMADHLEHHIQTPDSWTWPRLNWLLAQLPEPTVQSARTVTVRVAEGERAWHPASTKNILHGPATVTYVEYVDGGFRAIVETTEARVTN